MRLLGKGTGQEHPLLLTSRELPDGTRRRRLQAKTLKAALHHRPIFVVEATQPAGSTVPSHGNHIRHRDRKPPIHFLSLRYVCHAVLVGAEWEAVNQNAAPPKRP